MHTSENQDTPITRCAVCGQEIKLGMFDPDLMGAVGRCCVRALRLAETALVDAGFTRCTHHPDHDQ